MHNLCHTNTQNNDNIQYFSARLLSFGFKDEITTLNEERQMEGIIRLSLLQFYCPITDISNAAISKFIHHTRCRTGIQRPPSMLSSAKTAKKNASDIRLNTNPSAFHQLKQANYQAQKIILTNNRVLSTFSGNRLKPKTNRMVGNKFKQKVQTKQNKNSEKGQSFQIGVVSRNGKSDLQKRRIHVYIDNVEETPFSRGRSKKNRDLPDLQMIVNQHFCPSFTQQIFYLHNTFFLLPAQYIFVTRHAILSIFLRPLMIQLIDRVVLLPKTGSKCILLKANLYEIIKILNLVVNDYTGSVNKICMQQSDQGNYFCYLTIGNNVGFISNCLTSSLSILLAVYVCFKFFKMRGSHNCQTAFVYTNMLIWWLSTSVFYRAFSGSTVYSMWLYLNEDNGYSDEEMSGFSKFYFLIDWVNGYIIQLLLLYVPYHWCKGICLLFNAGNYRNGSTRGSEVFITTPYQGLETKVLPILKMYIVLRLTWLALPVLFFMLKQQSSLLFQIQIGCLLLDCVVITLSLLLGMISLKTSRDLIDMLDQDQIKRMFNQYLIIILASSIRFALDIIVFENSLQQFTFSNHCPPSQKHNTDATDVIADVAITLCAHYFPIFIITRMYTLEEVPEEICKSLIITTATSGTGLISGQ